MNRGSIQDFSSIFEFLAWLIMRFLLLASQSWFITICVFLWVLGLVVATIIAVRGGK